MTYSNSHAANESYSMAVVFFQKYICKSDGKRRTAAARTPCCVHQDTTARPYGRHNAAGKE